MSQNKDMGKSVPSKQQDKIIEVVVKGGTIVDVCAPKGIAVDIINDTAQDATSTTKNFSEAVKLWLILSICIILMMVGFIIYESVSLHHKAKQLNQLEFLFQLREAELEQREAELYNPLEENVEHVNNNNKSLR